MLLAWATADPLIEKVCLEVFTTNIGAIRLYRKLGFVEEGLRPKDIKFEGLPRSSRSHIACIRVQANDGLWTQIE